MLWDLSRIPHAMAKFTQPDGCMISLVTAADLGTSPCEFCIILQQISLKLPENPEEICGDNLGAERTPPVVGASLSFSAVLLLAVSPSCAVPPLSPLEPSLSTLPANICKVFGTAWTGARAGMRRPQLGWLCVCNDDGLVMSQTNRAGTPHAVLKTCPHAPG